MLRRCATQEAAHSIVRALVHSRLDYCNGVLACAPRGFINSLQSVLRCAAGLVLRLPPRESGVTQAMCEQLHTIPTAGDVSYAH